MKHLLKHPRILPHLQRGWKFLIAGGLGAVIDFSTLNLLTFRAHLDPRVANIFSTLLSSSVVFTVNKLLVFRDRKGDPKAQAAKFIVAYALAYFLNVTLTALFITIGLKVVPGLHLAILSNGSKALAIGLVMFWNYFLLHSFVFAEKKA